jgi:hypothetical protein
MVHGRTPGPHRGLGRGRLTHVVGCRVPTLLRFRGAHDHPGPQTATVPGDPLEVMPEPLPND